MRTGVVVLGGLVLVLSVPLFLYSLNGLSQFDNSFGLLARYYSAEAQQEYNQWQMLELVSVVFAMTGVVCMAIGLVIKNEIKHADYNQSPGRVF